MIEYDPEPPHTFLTYCIQIAIICFFAFILTYLARTKILKCLILSVLLLLFAIDFYLVSNFGHPVSPYFLTLILETNSNEANGFIENYIYTRIGLITVILTTFIPIAYLATNYLWRKYGQLCKHKICNILIGSTLCISIIGGGGVIYSYKQLFSNSDSESVGRWRSYAFLRPIDSITNLVYSFYHLKVSSDDLRKAQKSTYQSLKHCEVTTKDSINIILVIGESYIKKHSSLYGYYLMTCPNMSKEKDNGNLFVFNDVITPFAATNLSIKNILSCNSVSDNEFWFERPYFPAIFHSSGYNVYMYDNQRSIDRNIPSEFSLDAYLYNENICSMSYDKINDSTCPYDADFVKKYLEEPMIDKRSLVIYHLQGQHISASTHYPHTQEFMRFSLKDIQRNDSYLNDKKKQEIVEYDNATYYNDYVMSLLFDYYRDKNAVLIYFSDHGDEVYDYRDSMGRTDIDSMTSGILEYIYEIPFFIWVSNKYKEKYPNEIINIKNSIDKPFSTDNICHVLFYLAGIESYYNEKRNFISPNYIIKDRIIKGVEASLNYDAKN